MKIITGAAITAIKVIMIKVFKNFVPIWLMTFWTSSCVSLALASDKIGMNACENAPSPNSLLKKLGMRKATRKASVNSLAPKNLAMKKSRTKPKIRDKKVMPVTILLDFKKDLFIRMGWFYSSTGPRIIPTLEPRIQLTNCITSGLSDSETSSSLSI